MKLIFASNNAHKLEEARAIMPDIQILSLAEIGCHEEIPETQPTLQGNSLQKAEFVYNWCRQHEKDLPADVLGCFADDTGLEIEALNGDPGVYTARWAGEHCNPADNRKKTLTLLQGEPNRQAQFRTVVTFIPFTRLCRSSEPREERTLEPLKPLKLLTRPCRSSEPCEERTLSPSLFEGIVRGSIATEERGHGGFGYDPIFIPEGYDKTFAELPIELKNSISHRARAMKKFADSLAK